MGEREQAEELARSILIENLPFSTATRRVLIRKGCKTLADAFELPEVGLTRDLGRLGDELFDIKDLYERKPGVFLTRASRFKEIEREPRTGSNDEALERLAPRPPRQLAKTHTSPAGARRHARNASVPKREDCGDVYLPRFQRRDELLALERKARAELDLLEDHHETAIIAECLDSLNTDLDTLKEGFIELFASTHASLNTCRATRRYLPNAFLIYMADSCRRNYRNSTLWKNVFAELGVADMNRQGELKQLLLDEIRRRGLPLYNSTQRDYYYLYTMLLHAGLSEDIWRQIWKELLIPLSLKVHEGSLPEGRYPDGRMLVRLALQEGSSYRLTSKMTQSVFSDAPIQMLAPSLEEAFGVSMQYASTRLATGETFMFSGQNLSEAAIDGLSDYISERQEGPRRPAAAHGTHGGAGRGETGAIIYIPTPELRLDMADADRPVSIWWKGRIIPGDFIGYEVKYLVNGSVERSARVLDGVRGGLMEDCKISMPLAGRYDVEVKIIQPPKDGETEGREVSRRSSSFGYTKPGVYEFVMGSDGVMRLRKGLTVRRKTTISYLLSRGYRVEPRAGMELKDRYSSGGGVSVETYDVRPGACARIVDADGDEVSAWHDGFNVTYNNGRRIGVTETGENLYPCTGASELSNNKYLPTIVVNILGEASRGLGPKAGGLDVVCECDGRNYSIKRDVPYGSGVDTGGPEIGYQLMLVLSRSIIPSFVRHGRVRATLSSTGEEVLCFRFSVLPIHSLGISSLRFGEGGDIEATYSFRAAQAMFVGKSDAVLSSVDQGTIYRFRRPLSDGETRLIFATPGTLRMGASLQLAGIEADVSSLRLFATRPYTYADALGRKADGGMMHLSLAGSRSPRGLIVMLGYRPCAYIEGENSTSADIRAFRDPSALLPSGMGGAEGAVDLTARVMFGWTDAPTEGGDPSGSQKRERLAVADLVIARGVMGYGLGRAQLVSSAKGTSLRFENPLGMDLCYRAEGINGRHARDGILSAGDALIPLEADEVRGLSRGRPLYVTLVPKARFGKPRYSEGITIDVLSVPHTTVQ